MKWKISLLVAIVIGALAGSWVKNLPGFVIVAYEKTTYEMRLWVAVCLILAVIAGLSLLGLLLRSFIAGGGRLKGWHGGRVERRSRKKTLRGMIAFLEGRWKFAEDSMLGAAKSSKDNLIAYLIAAQAAQQQNAGSRRDHYLRLAHQSAPSAGLAIGLTQAELQIQQGQLEQALATLTQLKNQDPNHPYLLKLLAQVFEAFGDWIALFALLPELGKGKALEPEELQRIEHLAIQKVLSAKTQKQELEGLMDFWQRLSAAQRSEKANLANYAKSLIQFEQMAQAEKVLRPLVKNDLDPSIALLYAQAVTEYPDRQLALLESNNQGLKVALALGKLSFHAKFWGKAKQFLTQAIEESPSCESYWLLAKVLEELKEFQQANQVYQAGLAFAAKQIPSAVS